MPEPGATIMAMPVSSNERTRVFPAAPGPHPALAVPQSSCSASGSADDSASAVPVSEHSCRLWMTVDQPHLHGLRTQMNQF